MSKKEDIKDIFSILHDGCIEEISVESTRLRLKVNIQYLAELVDKSHECITLILKYVKAATFEPWSEENVIISDLDAISSLELGIISSEINQEDKIVVHSNCLGSKNTEFEGGKLIIDCQGYEILDQMGNLLSLKQVKELSTHYWNDIFDNQEQ